MTKQLSHKDFFFVQTDHFYLKWNTCRVLTLVRVASWHLCNQNRAVLCIIMTLTLSGQSYEWITVMRCSPRFSIEVCCCVTVTQTISGFQRQLRKWASAVWNQMKPSIIYWWVLIHTFKKKKKSVLKCLTHMFNSRHTTYCSSPLLKTPSNTHTRKHTLTHWKDSVTDPAILSLFW